MRQSHVPMPFFPRWNDAKRRTLILRDLGSATSCLALRASLCWAGLPTKGKGCLLAELPGRGRHLSRLRMADQSKVQQAWRVCTAGAPGSAGTCPVSGRCPGSWAPLTGGRPGPGPNRLPSKTAENTLTMTSGGLIKTASLKGFKEGLRGAATRS